MTNINTIQDFTDAVSSNNFAYARFDIWGDINENRGTCLVYHYTDKSPSGRLLVMVWPNIEEARQVLAEANRIN